MWLLWWNIMCDLRNAFRDTRTFMWFCTCVAAMMIRIDTAGVTSLIRALGLRGTYYDRMLDFFHSTAVDRDLLARLWGKCVLGFGMSHTINGRVLIIGDGIKAPKEGKCMPGVKSLHQESESNSKPEFIMGHSCQVVALCASASSGFFAIPLIARIHEGIVLSNRDKRTLIDKMALMIDSLNIAVPFYFVGDAYYAGRKMIVAMLLKGNHLVTRVRSNSVAYEGVEIIKIRARGRPKIYGLKVYLRNVFSEDIASFHTAIAPDGHDILLYSRDLIWKSAAHPVRFVFVIHPVHGKTIFMTTDLTMTAAQVLEAYSLRFRIELSFRQAIHVIGSYAYHFWMMNMDPISRGSGNQYLHKKSIDYRNAVLRKMSAYHLHLQVGVIAQGILQYIASSASDLVWSNFHSWIRTIRPGIAPSEAVTATALRNSFPQFLADSQIAPIFTKFIIDKTDLNVFNHLQRRNYG